MELKDLIGLHMLDAVDFTAEEVSVFTDYFENCSLIRFRLDGIVYTAIENPVDGYRSSMKDIFVSKCEMKNTFTPVQVFGRHRTSGSYDETDDVLELIDCVTGKVVIEVGTIRCNDYYPRFVSNFDPTGMIINTTP